MQTAYGGSFGLLRMCSLGCSVSIGYGDKCRISVCEAHPGQLAGEGWVSFAVLGTEYAMGLSAMTNAEWECFVESFVLLGISEEALPRFLELARKAFVMSEDSLAGCSRVFGGVTLTDDCAMSVRYEDDDEEWPMDGMMAPESDAVDAIWGISRADIDKMCANSEAYMKQLDRVVPGFRADAREVIQDGMATKIQSAFRGWQARMTYRWDVHTCLGRYLVMKDFDELIAC
jgi:hypothetical protein